MRHRNTSRLLTATFAAGALLLAMAGSALADDVVLPGDFFPEGIDRTSQGQFFVGSFVNGDIETFDLGDGTSSSFSSGVLDMAVGLYVDESIGTLWACGTRTFGSEQLVGVQGFDLVTAEPVAFHAFPGGGFCNDIAQDERGNLYVTDSVGFRIMTIAAADRLSDSDAEVWLEHPAFVLQPGEGTGLSINGIAYGKTRLWVVNISRGELYEIKVLGNGRPGKFEIINLDRPLNGPDGIEFIDNQTLVVAENFTGNLSRVEIRGKRGTVTPITGYLGDSPTTFTLADGQFWVAIGQLDRLFGNPNPPNLPFVVTTAPIPCNL